MKKKEFKIRYYYEEWGYALVEAKDLKEAKKIVSTGHADNTWINASEWKVVGND
jgi:hypothetical protein